MATLYVEGAYGRRYTKVENARADWAAGRDFKIFRGPYTSKRDAAEFSKQGFDSVVIELDDGDYVLWTAE